MMEKNKHNTISYILDAVEILPGVCFAFNIVFVVFCCFFFNLDLAQ